MAYLLALKFTKSTKTSAVWSVLRKGAEKGCGIRVPTKQLKGGYLQVFASSWVRLDNTNVLWFFSLFNKVLIDNVCEIYSFHVQCNVNVVWGFSQDLRLEERDQQSNLITNPTTSNTKHN